MERRIRLWRALRGSEREVIFRQEPARVAWPAVTDGSDLGGTITGDPPDGCCKAVERSIV